MKWTLILLAYLCFNEGTLAQTIKTYSFDALDRKLEQESREQFLVVNFWATWCKPCIEELPYFENLKNELNNEDIVVILVSLDMEKEKAESYARKKELQSEVLYLDEVDFNSWINRISPNWSGAIPATLMLAPSGKQLFHEGAFSQEDLNDTVTRFIQNNQ